MIFLAEIFLVAVWSVALILAIINNQHKQSTQNQKER